MIEFKVEDDSHPVLFNGNVTTVGKLINDKAKTDPTCEIAYHKHTLSPNKPGCFTCVQEHQVVFLKKEDSTDATQTNIGAKVPFSTWDSRVTRILWLVRWTAKGLMPVKPCVHFSVEVALATGRAAEITG